MTTPLPRMYDEIAEWFHLLTPPSEYANEWAVFRPAIWEALGRAPADLLELGSGGGNLATHYTRDVPASVLTDLSPRMLALSRRVNPACEHIKADMRTLRLDRRFDVVIVHDAVMYMTSEADLRAAMQTAAHHCRAGGVALFVPDFTRETFKPSTDHGGGDDEKGAGLRYLEWVDDPDPTDTEVSVNYAYLLREPGEPMRALDDHHTVGLFPQADWLRLLRETGFTPKLLHGLGDGSTADVFFIGRKLGG